MNKPLGRLLAFVCLPILFLPACSALKPRSSALAEPVTLSFAVTNGSRDYYTAQVKAFNDVEPNITIELKPPSTQGLDIREVSWIDAQTGGAEILDQALDLNPFIQQEMDFNRPDFYPGLLDAFTRDGKQLALPSGLDPYVLFCNLDLFDSRGVPYPSADFTWEEFKTIAMQLRDPDAGVYGYLPMPGYVDAILLGFTHGATLLDGSQPHLDSIEAIQAIEWYATLFSSLGAAPNAEQIQDEFGQQGVFAAIYRGLGGMWISEFSQIQRFKNDRIQYKVGIAPLPRDQNPVTVAQITGWVISSETKSPEAAWRWIRFLSDQPQPWSVPARRSVAESEQYTALIGKDQAAVARSAVQNAQMINSFDMTLFQPVMDAYLAAVAETIDGMVPPDVTLKEAQQQVNP